MEQQAGRQQDGFNKSPGRGNTPPGDIKCGAMINGSADDRKTESYVNTGIKRDGDKSKKMVRSSYVS